MISKFFIRLNYLIFNIFKPNFMKLHNKLQRTNKKNKIYKKKNNTQKKQAYVLIHQTKVKSYVQLI